MVRETSAFRCTYLTNYRYATWFQMHQASLALEHTFKMPGDEYHSGLHQQRLTAYEFYKVYFRLSLCST